MSREDRWYVRFRGHTLGPLTAEQIKTSVKKKELGPDDSLAPVHDPSWRPLRAVPDFFQFWEGLSRPRPVELAPLPPPSILWKKKAEKSKAPRVEASPSLEPPPQAAEAKAKAPEAAPAKRPKAKPKRAKAKKKSQPVVKAKEKIEARNPVPESTLPEIIVSVKEDAVASTVSKVPVEAPGLEPVVEAATANSLVKSANLLNKEAALLLASLRDWEEQEEPKTAPAPVPEAKPESPRVFFDRPEIRFASSEPMETLPKDKEKTPGRIELQLNLNLSKSFLVFALGLIALAAAALIVIETKKRGPEDFRLPDPSGPTAEPSTGDDPIPQLRAPTRPRRD